MARGTVNLFITPDGLRFEDHGGYESRNPSTIKLIQEAWERYPPTSSLQSTLLIHTEDGFNSNADYSYAITRPEDVNRCIPHFLFDCWKEVGIESYQRTFDEMVTAGQTPYADSRAFWIGANTNSLRVSACEMASRYPTIMDFRMMRWNRTNPGALHQHTSTYVSLVNHCKYRVLVDLGAGGFSARLPLLFASGRPVIVADRNQESWYYWDGTMVPWVHYIPGGSTPKSIFDAVSWTCEHPYEAAQIGKRGQEYAMRYLTHDAAVKRCAKLLWNV